MASGSSQRRCVFVGNIPYDATEEQLVQICEEVGPVVSFRLVLDRETGKPKGYGFCEYKDEETALSARRNLHGYEINGRQLRVDFAENDKGADRNREQGRGGPGLASNIGAPSILGDSSLHQPIGLQLAANAAGTMARVLGEAQTSGISLHQGASQDHSVLGSDPLTHYLAKMSRHQLCQIMTEMKALATQKGPLARLLLQTSSPLPKALFQAQIMLNMVTPQTLQMPNIQQTSSSVQQSPLQDGLRDQKAVVPPFRGQTPLQNVTQPGILAKLPHGRVSSLAQSVLISNPSAIQDGTVQPQLQHLQSGQPQYAPQTMILGKPGMPTFSSVDPKSLSGLSVSPPTTLITSKGLLPQIQPPLQQTKPIRDTSVGLHAQVTLPNMNIQQSTLVLPLSSQPGSSIDPLLAVGPEAAPVESRAHSANYDSAWGSRVNVHPSSITGLAEQPHMSQDGMELTGQPSKRVKLDGVSIIPQMGSSNTSRAKSEPAQVFDTGLTSVSQVVGVDGMQQSEKQISQLSPEMQKVLLEQVKSLTPEQLSSLPPEQRQQVIDLQQRLRLLDGLDAVL